MRLRSGRLLLVGRARPQAAGLLAGCVVLVIVLGVLVAHEGTADRFDRAVDAPVIAWFTPHPVVALRMAYPATLVPAGAVSLIAALACLARGWLRGAVLALLAVPVASGLNDALLKPLFHRTYAGVLSYPSGHTAAITALAATLTVLLLLAPHQAPGPETGPETSPGHGAEVGDPGRSVARGRRGRHRRHGPALALLHRHHRRRRPRRRDGMRARPAPRRQLASKDRVVQPAGSGARWMAPVAKRAR